MTGATGFIGSHCLRRFHPDEYEIHALSLESDPPKIADLCWHSADFFDTARVKEILHAVQPEIFLHLAWVATPGTYLQTSDNFRWLSASVDILPYFYEIGGSYAVVAGSCAEYQWDNGFLCEDSTPLLPNSIYGACKVSLYHSLRTFCRHHNLSFSWVRIFFPYGPLDSKQKLIPYTIHSLLNNRPAELSAGDQLRDFIYTPDIAEMIHRLLSTPVNGAINICTGKPVRVREVISLIAEQLDKREWVQFGKKAMVKDEAHILAGDDKKWRSVLGDIALTPLEEGIRQTIQWHKNQ